MKKVFAILVTFSLFISSCTFNVTVLTPVPRATDSETSPITPYVTQVVPSLIPTISATAELASPTPVPPTTDPVFYNARASSSPDDANQQSSFPERVRAVYVIWDYQNMRDGLQIKREWYLNGKLWLRREEAWDFGKYGANGTIRDVSIYDNDTGLDTGVYQLRLYINNVLQAIGPGISSPVLPWITFEIGAAEAHAGYASPDFQWNVEVFGEKRIVLQDQNGNSTDIYTAREVPYLAWFNDSHHFLFVDRDRSNQISGTSIGIRDDLWLVDVPSGTTHLLYKSDTSFAGVGGPVASPDGRYIASLEGSGFADACGVDTRLIFFELTNNFDLARVMKQQDFAGLPIFNDGVIYPTQQAYWNGASNFLVTMDGTCSADRTKLGSYRFNLTNQTVAQAFSLTPEPVPGDLGAGMIHGKVTDAATGALISNASVTCEQDSYTSAAPCSGTVLTNVHGEYAFNNVFFHDTDTITITVQAAGYETQEITKTSFTTNDLPLDFALNPTQ